MKTLLSKSKMTSANNSGLETRDHESNGVGTKNQRSSRNFLESIKGVDVKLLGVCASLLLVSIIAVGIFVACTKTKETNEVQSLSDVQKYEHKENSKCCDVECRKGKCTAYKSPCSCTCGFLGHPDCGGGGNKMIASDNLGVFCSETQLASHEPLISFMREKMKRDDMADVCLKIRNLFKPNVEYYEYTFVGEDGETQTQLVPVPEDERFIIPKDDVSKYYDYLKILDDFFNEQPKSVQELIMKEF